MKCAIVIGVNTVGNLTPLTGAVDGAKKFQVWAESQGYEVFSHYDMDAPVTYQSVRDSVRNVVDSRKYERMIIFFSGHGKWQGPGTEKWLLSKAATETAEAINVNASALASQGSGISHVVFISDACRSVVTDPQINYVTGNQLFSYGYSEVDTKIDLIYSTRAGDPSYEARSVKDGIAAFGVFTKCLLHGLNGNAPEIFSAFPSKDKIQKNVIESEYLYEYLRKTVPRELYKIDTSLKQVPDSQVGSRLPNFLAEFPATIDHKPERPNETLILEDSEMDYRLRSITNYMHLDSPSEAELIEDLLGIANEVNTIEFEEFQNLQYRPIKDWARIYTGVFIYRASDHLNSNAFSPNFRLAAQINQNKTIRYLDEMSMVEAMITEKPLKKNKPFYLLDFTRSNLDRPYLLPINNGDVLQIPILFGFISCVWIRKGKIMHISFQPSIRNQKYGDFRRDRERLEKRTLLVLKFAHEGRSELFADRLTGELLGDFLRRGKSLDPSLGLYAAYAYAQAGLWKDVLSVYDYMKDDREPVLYDVQMFADLMNYRKANQRDDTLYERQFPFLTQGWSYLNERQKDNRPILNKLAQYLVPALWTTFSKEAIPFLTQYLKNN